VQGTKEWDKYFYTRNLFKSVWFPFGSKVAFPGPGDPVFSVAHFERLSFFKGYNDYLTDHAFAIAVKKEKLESSLYSIQDIISRLNHRGQSESLVARGLRAVREEQITELSVWNKLSRLLDSKCQAENISITVKKELVRQHINNPVPREIPFYIKDYLDRCALLGRNNR
jgi:hypothetical protein